MEMEKGPFILLHRAYGKYRRGLVVLPLNALEIKLVYVNQTRSTRLICGQPVEYSVFCAQAASKSISSLRCCSCLLGLAKENRDGGTQDSHIHH
jgi:hypothetical protein